jgi:hypothetical protein
MRYYLRVAALAALISTAISAIGMMMLLALSHLGIL